MDRRPTAPESATDLPLENTFGVRCHARRAFVLAHRDDIPRATHWLADNTGATVVGGGSNLLFACDAVDAALLVRLRGRRVIAAHTEGVVVEFGAGEPWDDAVRWSLDQGLCGLENLAMIPGLCGAAPVQNIGAYGVELADSLEAVEVVEVARVRADRTGTRTTHWLAAADCSLGYRDSVFRREPGRWLITAIRLRLAREPRLRLDYGDLRAELQADRVTAPGARDVERVVRRIRARKLPDPAQLGNAGSFFKNPVVPAARLDALRAIDPAMPAWPAAVPGFAKLPAAWLIDRAGWRGHRQGDAGVHANHALVLVNHGAARGAEILALAERIRADVARRFGVMLEPEPIIVRDA